MKYSIIIVAYKAHEYLQACLDSIQCSLSRDYEVIIVDNSPTPMREFEGKCDTFIYPGENLGFAEACNVGAAHARGEILCLLNPDTQVYGDWLERLSRYLEIEGGQCHAVGPVSNMAAGLQNHRLMLPIYPSREEWKPCPTKVLIGFCFMIAKETWKSLGGMDKGCFLGCDDLDISWRMTQQGMRLGVASDVYVHHECHKSMEANHKSSDFIKQSEDYLKSKLIAHYGQGKVPSAIELWGADFMDTGHEPTISVCMIVKDEADQILHPVDAGGYFANECVLTNTGNSDELFHKLFERGFTMFAPGESKSMSNLIRERKELRCYTKPWSEDFAEARNHSLERCEGDWILWLDADDRLPQETIDQLKAPSFRRLLHRQHLMLRFKVRNVSKTGEVFEEFMQTRMFRRTESKWEGRIHEHLVYSGQTIEDCPTIIIDHTGYSDEETVLAKSKRNLRLLETEPDGPDTWLHRAHSHGIAGAWNKAVDCFFRAKQGAPPDMVDYLNYQIGICMENLGNYALAAKYYDQSERIDGLGRMAEMAYRQGLPYARALFHTFLEKSETEDLGRFVNHTASLKNHALSRIKELSNGAT